MRGPASNKLVSCVLMIFALGSWYLVQVILNPAKLPSVGLLKHSSLSTAYLPRTIPSLCSARINSRVLSTPSSSTQNTSKIPSV
ncbi:hypothetical protein BDQ12DRAFT_675543 [Crucibulum laeve]|uniref:Uncharacterized protein n=1 Tax=Crucibulum laeve TaxID=68775 RepID=A0A5C3MGL2_9AGAR|nr:hypothetical protein BDQ12DRAFT_675543 [Crucibulum laeve]